MSTKTLNKLYDNKTFSQINIIKLLINQIGLGIILACITTVNAWSSCPTRSDVGMNISEFNYFTSAVPFKDVALQNVEGIKSIDPITGLGCTNSPQTDDEGYPLENQSNCISRLTILRHIKPYHNLTPYRGGNYVLTYSGLGAIKLSGDAKNQINHPGRITFDVNPTRAGITVDILETSANNHLRNIHIVNALDEATYKIEPYNQNFLDILKPFNVLRFMAAARTNTDNVQYRSIAQKVSSNSAVLPVLGKNNNGKVIPLPSWQSGTLNETFALIHRTDTNQWESVLLDTYDKSTHTITFKNSVAILNTPPQQMPEIIIKSFYNRTWKERTLPNSINQTTDAGIAWEYMIQLANILKKDIWINVPTAADNEYITFLARLLKKELNPTLKIYLEYSNEVWVNKYPQAMYAYQKASQQGLKTAQNWYVFRSIEVFRLFNTVFEENDLRSNRAQSRLIRILSEQTTQPEEVKKVLDWQRPYPTNNLPASEFADALGVINYFGLKKVNFDYGSPENEPSLNSIYHALTASINLAFDTTQPNSGWLSADALLAKERGLKMVSYEGGHNMTVPKKPDRVDLLPIFQSALDDPRMKAIYKYNWKMWTSLANKYAVQMGPMTQYYAIGTPGIDGFWGMLESAYQPPKTSQRFLALTSCPAP